MDKTDSLLKRMVKKTGILGAVLLVLACVWLATLAYEVFALFTGNPGIYTTITSNEIEE